jgi:hypothetical protein
LMQLWLCPSKLGFLSMTDMALEEEVSVELWPWRCFGLAVSTSQRPSNFEVVWK